jgi:hypothetical protein
MHEASVKLVVWVIVACWIYLWHQVHPSQVMPLWLTIVIVIFSAVTATRVLKPR